MSNRKRAGLIEFFRDCVSILNASTQLAQGEQPCFYRVAALQLRMLFCDTTRRHGKIEDLSLIGRIFPDLRLPQIAGWNPTRIVSDEPQLHWRDWLEQPTPFQVSVRNLIRQVCDREGGAHVDPGGSLSKFDPTEVSNAILFLSQVTLQTLSGCLSKLEE